MFLITLLLWFLTYSFLYVTQCYSTPQISWSALAQKCYTAMVLLHIPTIRLLLCWYRVLLHCPLRPPPLSQSYTWSGESSDTVSWYRCICDEHAIIWFISMPFFISMPYFKAYFFFVLLSVFSYLECLNLILKCLPSFNRIADLYIIHDLGRSASTSVYPLVFWNKLWMWFNLCQRQRL